MNRAEIMINKFIQTMRKKYNFTQEKLALDLGISRPTYVQIEQGKRDVTISEAKKLADIFGININSLISGKDTSPKIIFELPQEKEEKDFEIRVTKENLKKFEQVLLYILNKAGGKPNVGETVIYKLLYFIDFDYYEKFEESLMGVTYLKRKHGPVPAGFQDIVAEMEKEGKLKKRSSSYFSKPQIKYDALVEPDLNLLTARESAFIDEVLARLSNKNAKELSDMSHEDTPWKTQPEFGKPLNYDMVFYRDDKLSVRSYEDEL